MDDGLVLRQVAMGAAAIQAVLILIVMEDGLVPSEENYLGAMSQCLNPCCSGRWSRTINDYEYPYNHINVLILVVVEDDLVQSIPERFRTMKNGLNPCCNGRWYRTDRAYSSTRRGF